MGIGDFYYYYVFFSIKIDSIRNEMFRAEKIMKLSGTTFRTYFKENKKENFIKSKRNAE